MLPRLEKVKLLLTIEWMKLKGVRLGEIKHREKNITCSHLLMEFFKKSNMWRWRIIKIAAGESRGGNGKCTLKDAN